MAASAAQRIALFGGTFDPVHRAHLEVARLAASSFALDRVWMIPAGQPPHKQQHPVTAYEHRLRMLELACASESLFVPSRIEDRPGNSYTVETVERVRRQINPADELFFLIGADAFAEVRTWFRWQDVIRMLTFLVVSRPGHEYQAPEGASVLRLETLAMEVSSSEIRRRLQQGEAVADVPASVLAYIAEHGLYGFPGGG